MAHIAVSLFLPGLLISPASAQTPVSFGTPAGNFTTKAYSQAAVLTATRANNDFSDEALRILWQQVGPIEKGPVTAVVNTTSAEIETIARPGSLHPLMPSYLSSNLFTTRLPAGFTWGVSSSAYQIEGAADADGKGPSIWDLLAHRVPNFVADNTTADVAASHYYLYKKDIARLASLGVQSFAFSTSWPRFFPFGTRDSPVNEAAIAHYDDVIQTILGSGMEAHITLFHWDTPLALFNQYGAWTSPEIVDDFFNYAKFVISRYDALVSGWFTINEPQYCNWQYSNYPAGEYYPAFNNLTGGPATRFACGHYTLLAHAKVAKWYHNEFRGRHKITFKNSGNYPVANSTSEGDQTAVRRSLDFSLGWFGGPWTADGDYPQTLRDTLPSDVLPTLTQADKDLIRGSCDFFAIDPYSSYTAFEIEGGADACAANASHPAWPECAGSNMVAADRFHLAPAADPGVSWLVNAPNGLRAFLNAIQKDLFPSVTEIQVTEFGFAEPYESSWGSVSEAAWDLRRADYFQGYLDAILAAVVEDGINVTGAWAWAVFDNFEWLLGNEVRFGLQYVNYTSLERTPKASMFQVLNWFSNHGPEQAAANSTIS